MNKQVEQVKSEIERLLNEPAPSHDSQCKWEDGYWCALYKIEEFIDSMPVEPKFKVGDVVHSTNGAILTIIGIGQYCYHCDNDYSFGFNVQDEFELVEEPVSDDLEKVAYTYSLKCYPLKTSYGETSPNPEVKDAVIYGANWQKQQMMKDVMEYKVMDLHKNEDGESVPSIIVDLPKSFDFGDKVKVIIIKEN